MPVSLLSCSRHSDLLVLVSPSLSPSPLSTASTLTTAQDTRYVDTDTPTSSLLPSSSCVFLISRDRGLLLSHPLPLTSGDHLPNSFADTDSALHLAGEELDMSVALLLPVCPSLVLHAHSISFASFKLRTGRLHGRDKG